ncbi:MAG: F0F1 ATP synthase subunit A, partial [candidate division Zixibacteria bacterium]|nr:F0F1 ATP synthase subunit A [candidate division Zixibacteria bacterium]
FQAQDAKPHTQRCLVGSEMCIRDRAGGHGAAVSDGHAAGGAHAGPPHLPSLIWLIGWAFGIEDVAWVRFLEHWINVFFAFVVAIFFTIVAMSVYRRRQMIPGRLQNFLEWCVESMYNFIYSILGHETRKYLPFLGTLFFYILALNWIGMIPLGHSPSTSINITASMAVLVFLYAQWTGIRRLGIGGYLYHLAGSPVGAVGWSMVIIMFPLHIIGELAKPFSLSLRLFGNITGEDTLIAVFVTLGIMLISFSPVGVPLQIPFYFLGLLLSTIQALVFTLLSTIYILLMLPHDEAAH